MIKITKYTVFFVTGAIGYGLIEIMWRGYTHWAMLLAGGICFVIFSYISKKFEHRSLLFKSAICAVSVTFVECIFGIIFNIILKENVWDYSNMPFNFLGQICPLYTLLWGILGFVFIPLADLMNKKMSV